jgi:glyoxylase I family protein
VTARAGRGGPLAAVRALTQRRGSCRFPGVSGWDAGVSAPGIRRCVRAGAVVARPDPCDSRRARKEPGMVIALENIGIAVRDIEEAIAFFVDLGLSVAGRDTVSGAWADIAVGLDGNHAKIAVLVTPDGHGQIELFEYLHPEAIEVGPTLPNHIGMHRVAFSVDDIDTALAIAAEHGCHPLRGVATYEDMYKLTYLRGPSDILVMLAEDLRRGRE